MATAKTKSKLKMWIRSINQILTHSWKDQSFWWEYKYIHLKIKMNNISQNGIFLKTKILVRILEDSLLSNIILIYFVFPVIKWNAILLLRTLHTSDSFSTVELKLRRIDSHRGYQIKNTHTLSHSVISSLYFRRKTGKKRGRATDQTRPTKIDTVGQGLTAEAQFFAGSY